MINEGHIADSHLRHVYAHGAMTAAMLSIRDSPIRLCADHVDRQLPHG